MTRFISFVFALGFAAGAFGQVSTGLFRQPETENKRKARLASYRRQKLIVRNMMEKDRAAASAMASLRAQAISIPCPTAIIVSNPAFSQLQTLCDVGNNGTADFVGAFRQFGREDYVSAMFVLNGYLFTLTGDGTIDMFTDKQGRGVVDALYTQPAVGLAYSNRIIPVSDTEIYTEDSIHGQLFHYLPQPNQRTTTDGNNLPQLASTANGSTLLGNLVYSIDQTNDSVISTPLNNSTLQTVYQGYTVSAITLDQSGNLFVEEAGDCNDQQPVSMDVTTPSDTTCQPSQIKMVSQNGSVVLLPASPLLNVFYSFQNAMFALAGNLYVGSLLQNDDGSLSQIILQYRYQENGVTFAFQAPTIFASAQQLGQYGWVNAITSFAGGPVQ